MYIYRTSYQFLNYTTALEKKHLVLSHFRYKGASRFTMGNTHDFLEFPPDSEEAECFYEVLCEMAKSSKSVEALLLYCISNGYLERNDYILRKPNTKWFLEFELIALVSSQEAKLQHWSEKWNLLDSFLLEEVSKIAELSSGILVTKIQFPMLFEWMARHIFSLPVHNALAERQFNLAELYLDPNMSEESNQSIQLFVQNVIHEEKDRKSDLRTTQKTRNDYRERMIDYSDSVTPELIQKAKENIDAQKKEIADHPTPLKPEQVAADRWENLKQRSDGDEIIQELEKSGREMEIKWKSKTLRDKGLEAERSFKPSFSENVFGLRDDVPSLQIICASEIRKYGDEISIDNLPMECYFLIRYLPELIKTDARSENEHEHSQNIAEKQKRLLPKWMRSDVAQDHYSDEHVAGQTKVAE